MNIFIRQIYDFFFLFFLSDEDIHILFSKNRWEIIDTIKTNILNGITIIIDRYSYSGIAFSVAKGLDF